MRISALPDDPDHWMLKGFASGQCAVVVDGTDVTDICVEADDDAGYADIFRLDPKTGLLVDDSEFRPIIDRMRGSVAILPFSLR
jgi:hypothetical protein